MNLYWFTTLDVPQIRQFFPSSTNQWSLFTGLKYWATASGNFQSQWPPIKQSRRSWRLWTANLSNKHTYHIFITYNLSWLQLIQQNHNSFLSYLWSVQQISWSFHSATQHLFLQNLLKYPEVDHEAPKIPRTVRANSLSHCSKAAGRFFCSWNFFMSGIFSELTTKNSRRFGGGL